MKQLISRNDKSSQMLCPVTHHFQAIMGTKQASSLTGLNGDCHRNYWLSMMLRDLGGNGGRKIARDRGGGWLQGTGFQTQQEPHPVRAAAGSSLPARFPFSPPPPLAFPFSMHGRWKRGTFTRRNIISLLRKMKLRNSQVMDGAGDNHSELSTPDSERSASHVSSDLWMSAPNFLWNTHRGRETEMWAALKGREINGHFISKERFGFLFSGVFYFGCYKTLLSSVR